MPNIKNKNSGRSLDATLERIKRDIAEREKTRVYQLPIWPEPFRAVPNSILRSALFPAIKPSDRKPLTRKILASTKDITVRFTGIQFSQSDLDVFEQAVHLARMHPLGTQCHFTYHGFLKALGKSTGKSQHEWLKDVFSRLTASAVEIQMGTSVYEGSLIQEQFRDESSDQAVLLFNPKLLSLYDEGYTQYHHEVRRKLGRKPLALWLSGYYQSHRKPYPVLVDTLRTLCGSNASLNKFRENLGPALDEMVSVGILNSWEIGENDKVYVDRPAPKFIESAE